jgi:hypothetical protein
MLRSGHHNTQVERPSVGFRTARDSLHDVEIGDLTELGPVLPVVVAAVRRGRDESCPTVGQEAPTRTPRRRSSPHGRLVAAGAPPLGKRSPAGPHQPDMALRLTIRQDRTRDQILGSRR